MRTISSVVNAARKRINMIALRNRIRIMIVFEKIMNYKQTDQHLPHDYHKNAPYDDTPR